MQITRRRLINSAAAIGLTYWSVRGGADARTDPNDVLTHVDPELRAAAIRMLRSSRGQPPFSIDDVVAARRGGVGRPTVPRGSRRELVPRAIGGGDVPVYLFNSRRGAARPAVLHLHGGGFMLGGALDAAPRLQQLAAALDCVVVSVEYRLAPETPFPGALDDSYDAFRWLHEKADGLGIDPTRIAVLGESAGGGLASLLSLLVRDRGAPLPVLQVLIYPMIDDRTGSTVHPRRPLGTLAWSGDINRIGWRAFLGAEPGGKDVAKDAVPARRDDLSGLPPTFVGVGSLDLLLAEDVEYAHRLVEAHVPTELLVVDGAFHAFDVVVPESRLAQSFRAAEMDALQRAFARR